MSSASTGTPATAPFPRSNAAAYRRGVRRRNPQCLTVGRCRRVALAFEIALRLQAFELHLRVVDERHRGGDGAVAGALGDQAVHVLADASVGGVALRRGAQLDD